MSTPPAINSNGRCVFWVFYRIESMCHMQVVNAAAAVPVYVVEKLGRKNQPGDEAKPMGARKQVVTASAVSFTVRLPSFLSAFTWRLAHLLACCL